MVLFFYWLQLFLLRKHAIRMRFSSLPTGITDMAFNIFILNNKT